MHVRHFMEILMRLPTLHAAQVEHYRQSMCEAVDAVCALEVVHLVAEYAADGFTEGQKVDVLNKRGNWCVAEVICVSENAVKVKYLGWTSGTEEWIPCPSDRIEADVFSKSIANRGNPTECLFDAVSASSRFVQTLLNHQHLQDSPSHGIYQAAMNAVLYFQHCLQDQAAA
jgi:hypothetical protein